MATNAAATAFSNQRKLDRASNGNLVTVYADTTTNGVVRVSTDGGLTWASGGADIAGFTNGSIFIDADDYLHVVWKQSGTGGGRTDAHNYYVRGTPNAARTSWTFAAAVTVSANTNLTYSDVIAHREGTGWVAHVVISQNQTTTSDRTHHVPLTIASDGATTLGTFTVIGGPYGNTVHKFPSIDFHHTGDGKTVAGGTPHLYVGWSAGSAGAGLGIRFRKAVYSAGAWTWNAEREIDPNRHKDANSDRAFQTLFDGTRVIIAGSELFHSNGTLAPHLYERDATDTTTTDRGDAPAPRLFDGSSTYDASGNVYIIGMRGDTGAGLALTKWTRATSAWSTSNLAELTPTTRPAVSMKRGYGNSRAEWVYTSGNNSPYSVKYDFLQLNVAPLAPTLVAPANSAIFDRATTQRFDWDFHDPDTGDSQSKYDLQYRLTSDTAWTTVTGTTPNTYHDFLADTFAAGDYEWQVRTYDAQGVVGPYSSSSFFTAANAPAAPTITDPGNGGTVNTDPYLVQWSYPTQGAYQLRKLDDNAGAVGSTVLFDSGVVESTTARSRSVAFPVQDRFEHVQVRVRDSGTGLWSPYASHRVAVSYTRPVVARLATSASNGSASISVLVVNDPPNLLPNDAASSFEDGTVGGWTAIGETTVANSSAAAAHGSRSLLATHTNGATAGGDFVRLIITTTPGATYTLSWSWMTASGAPVVAVLAAAVPFASLNSSGPLTVPASFARSSLTFTATTAETDLIFDFKNAGTGEAFYLDAVQVEQGSTATAYHTPSTPTVNTVDVLRRVVNSGSAGERIAAALPANATYVDRTPASGVAYEYLARSYGANGTQSDSVWTP